MLYLVSVTAQVSLSLPWSPWRQVFSWWGSNNNGVIHCNLFQLLSFLTVLILIITGWGHAKMCLMPYVNNKGADQPAHPLSLISTFAVRCLDSICILAISKVSRFYPASVAEQSGLNVTWSKIPKDTFSRDVAHMKSRVIMSASNRTSSSGTDKDWNR